MVFSNNLLMGAASSTAAPAAGWVPKGAIWFDGSDDYLYRTPIGAGNRKTYSYSFWAKQYKNTTNGYTLEAGSPSGNSEGIRYAGSTDCYLYIDGVDGGGSGALATTALYRDPTAWYHVLYTKDTTDSVAADRVRLYVNGREIYDFTTRNNPALDAEGFINNTVPHRIGAETYTATPGQLYAGYLSEAILLDGYARPPSDFGTEDANGVWIPKDPTVSVTAYKGTNGFWLDFADTTSTTTIGYDVSGNGNHFATNGFASGTSNWTYDRPADDSATTTGNLGTWNPLQSDSDMTLAEGNTKVTGSSGGGILTNTMYVDAEDANGYYYRCLINTSNNSGYPLVGIHNTGPLGPTFVGGNTSNNGWSISCGTGSNSGKPFHGSGTGGTSLFTFSSGDYVDICIKAGKLYFGQNGTWSGDPDAETGEAFSGITGLVTPAISNYNGGTAGVSTLDILGGTAPSGAKRFATYDLPAPTITNPSLNFLPVLYEGNGTGQRVGNFIPFTDSKTVNYSARFDSGDSDYLSYTYPSVGSTTDWTLSVWFKRGDTASDATIIAAGAIGNHDWIQWQSDGTLRIVLSGNDLLVGYQKFVGSSTWTNLVFSSDMNNGTADQRFRVFVNGTDISDTSYWSTDNRSSYSAWVYFNDDINHEIGKRIQNAGQLRYYDGYMSEMVFIDGTALTASSFGETDTSTNRWIPKDVSGLTFGTNGFYLDMALGNALGTDVSGNSPANTFAMTNMDTTNGSNQMYDTPTRNYNVMDGTFLGASWGTTLASGLTQGNLKFTRSSGDAVGSAFMGAGSGKWYVEIVMDTVVASNSTMCFGIVDLNNLIANQNLALGTNSYAYRNYSGSSTSSTTGQKWPRDTAITAGTGYGTGDVLGIAFDLDAGYIWMAKNNTWYNDADGSAGNPTAGTFPLLTGIAPSGPLNPAKWAISLYFNDSHAATFNFGQWRYFDGGATTLDTTADGYFKYTPPTDFLAFHQDNLAANTAGITGLSWIKNLDAEDYHIWFDRARGAYNYLRSSNLYPNTTDAYANQATNANSVQRFLQQGVQVGNMNEVNTSAESYVLWNWANDGTSTANTDGTITGGSTVRVNSDAGFSIVTYSGDGTNPTTVGHGLGVKPDFIVLKGVTRASGTAGWYCYHSSIGATAAIWLDLGDAAATNAAFWNNTEPTSTVWSMQANTGMNQSGSTYVAYCWAGVEGYSQFGEYTGNGSNDGPVIYTGFSPNYILLKRTDATGYWILIDGARKKYNGTSATPTFASNWDDTNNSGGATNIDFLSNGFKLRLGGTSYPTSNLAATPYIYAAFAENPFGGSGVAQAKAR